VATPFGWLFAPPAGSDAAGGANHARHVIRNAGEIDRSA